MKSLMFGLGLSDFFYVVSFKVHVSVLVLLTSEPYCKFKIFLMKQIGLGEDNDDDVQETNGDQSRTISVPEAVVTQILPPATGKYTYSMLNNRNLMCINVF